MYSVSWTTESAATPGLQPISRYKESLLCFAMRLWDGDTEYGATFDEWRRFHRNFFLEELDLTAAAPFNSLFHLANLIAAAPSNSLFQFANPDDVAANILLTLRYGGQVFPSFRQKVDIESVIQELLSQTPSDNLNVVEMSHAADQQQAPSVPKQQQSEVYASDTTLGYVSEHSAVSNKVGNPASRRDGHWTYEYLDLVEAAASAGLLSEEERAGLINSATRDGASNQQAGETCIGGNKMLSKTPTWVLPTALVVSAVFASAVAQAWLLTTIDRGKTGAPETVSSSTDIVLGGSSFDPGRANLRVFTVLHANPDESDKQYYVIVADRQSAALKTFMAKHQGREVLSMSAHPGLVDEIIWPKSGYMIDLED